MNCVDDDPEFVDFYAHDYHLSACSPCIDHGTKVKSIEDLDGMVRPLDGNDNGSPVWDIGAYEFLNATADSDGDTMLDGWELRYGLNPTDAADAAADSDGDGRPNEEESTADTNPTNDQSFFQIMDVTATNSCAVWFNCSTARVYDLLNVGNLATGQWSTVNGMTNRPGHQGGSMNLTATNDAVQGYYRVRVRMP